MFLIITFASSIAALNHHCEDFVNIPVGALSLMELTSDVSTQVREAPCTARAAKDPPPRSASRQCDRLCVSCHGSLPSTFA